MGVVSRLKGETRNATFSAPPQWLVEALNPGGTLIGRSVTVDNALGLVPVYSAVSRIAGAVGTLPLIVYEGNQRAEGKQLWKMLHDQPNPEMSADEVWEIVQSHLLLWGNAYLYKKQGAMGVTELWPLSPRRVQVGRVDGIRTFFIDGKPFYEKDILQVRGLSEDGLVGYSPIQVAKQSLANAMAQQEFVAEFLNEGGRPSVLLKHPNEISPEAAKRLKTQWDSTTNGGTVVLEEGITVEKMTMALNDAQFIEQQQFSDLRVAQMFNLPPAMLGAKSGDSLTYSTNESQGIEFVTFTLRRWLVRIEKSLSRGLLPAGCSAEFLVEGLLRADTKTRYEAYQTALVAGFMDVAEVRERENLPPKEIETDEDSE